MELQWNGQSEEQNSFSRSMCGVVKNKGGNSIWGAVETSYKSALVGTNSGAYKATAANVQSFSKFSVSSDAALLNGLYSHIHENQFSAFPRVYIAPNPSTEYVKVYTDSEILEQQKLRLTVKSVVGLHLYSAEGNIESLNQKIETWLENMAAGTYLLEIEAGSKVQVIKWLVVK